MIIYDKPDKKNGDNAGENGGAPESWLAGDYLKSSARSVVQLLRLGVFTEAEVRSMLRAAGPLAVHAALTKSPRNYRAVMSILLGAAQLEQTEIAAADKRDGRERPPALFQQQINNYNLGALSVEELEKLAEMQEKMVGTPVPVAANGTSNPNPAPGVGQEGAG